MNRTSTRRLLRSLVVFLLCAVVVSPGAAVEFRKKKATPGATFGSTPVNAASAARNLQSFYSESGPLYLSLDAVGTVLSFGTVEVDKPEGAVVRRAFLIAATGAYGSEEIHDGQVRLEGRRVLWNQSIRNVVGGWNAMAEVTDLLKPKIDSAEPGIIIVEVGEDNSEFIDGVTLAVVFELNDTAVYNEISLFFGAHGAASNGFTIELSQPVPADVSSMRFEMGVGISFSLQTSSETNQYTVIDVNGRRLTASAGGPDDGSPLAGALLTVGGTGDNPANPADPVAMPSNLSSDDEYYDLTPFISPGDTRIEISTANPSKNDNLFFASFFARHDAATGPRLSAEAAPVFLGGIALPDQAVDQIRLVSSNTQGAVGSESEIVATVLGSGTPLPGINVQLRIVSGPHAGATSSAQTDVSGRASFRYRGVKKGTDLIVAVVDDAGSAVAGSNVLLYEWAEEMYAAIDIEPGLCPSTFDPRMQEILTVALMGTPSFDVNDVDAGSLYLEGAAPVRVQYRDVSQPGDGADCPCSSDGRDGLEDIVMLFRIQDVFSDLSALSANASQQLRLIGKLKSGPDFEATNCVMVANSANTTTVPSNVLVPTEKGFGAGDNR